MSPPAADVAFLGGAVYKVDAARSWAEAVAVTGERIVAVGSDAEVREHVGASTRVYELRGRMLVPGFQDAHVHASAGGLDRLRCDLTEVHGRADYVAAIGAYAAAHPQEPWILGAGWSMDVFPDGIAPREDLDAVVPDRPVFLVNRDHHGAWANSRALELAGVGADTPDPPDGRIERDADGRPVGTLQEGAMRVVEAAAPEVDAEQRVRGVLAGQAYLHSLGITGWQEAIVGTYPGVPDCYDAYRSAAARGELSGRVVGALWWDRLRGAEQVDELLERRAGGSVGRFNATTVKIMQDGVCESFTAAMLAPYLERDGRPGSNRGLSYVGAEDLCRHVTRLDAEGFQVHIHAIGDRAVREGLDAFETARRANGAGDQRHHMAHLQFIHPDDLPRFRALGVTANMQPLWANNDPQMTDLTMPFLGAERSGWQYPWASLVRHGTMLAVGSDWSVSSPNPLLLLHVAVNRLLPEGGQDPADPRTQEPFLPHERLDLATALAAATAGSAYVNHHDETGSVERGRLADLVLLDRNLFAHPVGEIADARVELTMVGGQVVYSGEAFA